MSTVYGIFTEGSTGLEVAAFLSEAKAKKFLAEHPESEVHYAGGVVKQIPRVIRPVAVPAAVLCRACSTQAVTSRDPKRYPYCRSCFYTGRAGEIEMAREVAAFQAAFPDADVMVLHTGGGCFMLTVGFHDDGGNHYGLTDGEASLPQPGDGWGFVGHMVFDTEGDEDLEQSTVLYDYMDNGEAKIDTWRAVAAISAHRRERGRA